MRQETKERIAVLGAGPMGLAVAYQLVKDGFQPVIFEADDRIGGQAASFDFDGLKIERFYHFHCTSDTAMFEVLADLGLTEKMRWAETKMGYYYQAKVQAWGNPFALLLFSGLGIIPKLRYGLHVFTSTHRKNWKPLDKLETVAWLKTWIGEEAYRVLWEKLIQLKFFEHAHSTSAAWTWSRIRRVGQSRYNIFREKLGYLEEGSDTLLKAMRAHIERGGGVFHLKTAVEKVVIQEERVIGIKSQRGFEKFEKVISTIPVPYLPKILSDLPENILDMYRSIENIPVVCVIAKLKKNLTQNFWLNINDPEIEIPGIIEYTNLRPLNAHILYAPYYMSVNHPKFTQSDEAFKDEFKANLHKINPALQEDDFINIHVSRYRHAQPICTPGFLKKLPPTNLPIRGLWAADTSYYYPEDRGISESIAFGRIMAKDAMQ